MTNQNGIMQCIWLDILCLEVLIWKIFVCQLNITKSEKSDEIHISDALLSLLYICPFKKHEPD